MELFSEVYSCYYTAMGKIINESLGGEISEETVRDIIKTFAFEESDIFIIPKLESKSWNFFDEENKCKIKNNTDMPLTKIQKMWLCAIFNDEKINLFFDEKEVVKIKKYFEDNNIEPMFRQNDFYYFDQFRLGDDYSDKRYREHFKKLVDAVKSKQILNISYSNRKDKEINKEFLVLKIEYSKKNNRHRVYCAQIQDKRRKNYYLLNVARIIEISNSENEYNEYISFEKYAENNLANEPIVLEISNERDALERCMVQFANFNKRTEYNEETKKYLCYIYYNKDLETELLIQVMSFVPLVKVLGHSKFLELFMERVRMQKKLMLANCGEGVQKV